MPFKREQFGGSLSPKHYDISKIYSHSNSINQSCNLYNLCHKTCNNFLKRKNKLSDNESLNLYFNKVIEKTSSNAQRNRPIYIAHNQKRRKGDNNHRAIIQSCDSFSSTNVDFNKYKQGMLPLMPISNTNIELIRPDTRIIKENICNGLDLDIKFRPVNTHKCGLPDLNSVSHKKESLMFSIDESIEHES